MFFGRIPQKKKPIPLIPPLHWPAPVRQTQQEPAPASPTVRSFRALDLAALSHPQLSIAAHKQAHQADQAQRITYAQRSVEPSTILQVFARWVEELPPQDSLRAVLQTAELQAGTSCLTLQLVSNTQIRLVEKSREHLLQALRQRLDCQHFQLYTELVLAQAAQRIDAWQQLLGEFPAVAMLVRTLELERID